MTLRPWRLAPIAAALIAVAVYFAIDPRISDLPAAEFRTWLFDHEGFTIWNGQWYAGHHTPGYSIIFPPLSVLLGGPEVVGAIYTVIAAALFEPLARRHFGERAARWPSIWFGLAAGTLLFSSRLPWGLGATFGLAALLALQRRRPALAAVLTVLATLSSPVAGAFLAMGAVAYAFAGHRREGALIAAAGLGPPVLLTAAFPEGGYHPFVFSSFWIVPVVSLGAAELIPARQRTLRYACVLYALASFGSFVVHTPFGGNAVRLGQLVGGPLLLAAVLAWPPHGHARKVAAAALLVVLAWWQWAPIVREAKKTIDDPSTQASYYRPLLGFLKTQPGVGRVEIPTLRSQWESYYVAKATPIARGWERQVDIKLNGLFYDNKLTAERYRHWLGENGVRFVALPDAKLGYAGDDEGALIRRGLPYLRPVFRSAHWRVFAVTAPHPLALPEGGAAIDLTQLTPDTAQLDVRRPGAALLRVHFSPYWRLPGGCVEPAGDWTRVETRRTGLVRLVMTFAPGRVVSRGRRCD
ncbi:MAG: hypothetical protein QOJ07_2130 [Thermoleophilaceae bacterium]|nr:hypothetical protein [Thermoleophilaceae bacterium]